MKPFVQRVILTGDFPVQMVISEHKLGPGPLSPGRRKWYTTGFVSYLRNLKKTLHLYVVLYLLGLSHVQQDVFLQACVISIHSFICCCINIQGSHADVKVIHYEVEE